MSKTTVKNPTASSKAIRVVGGHKILKRGESDDIDLKHLSKAEIEGYERAGLLFGKAAKDDPSEEEKEAAAKAAQAKVDADKAAADKAAADKAAAEKAAADEAAKQAQATTKKD